MDDPDQKVFIWCQAITPGAAVKALDATERNPWLPGCGDAPQEECPSRGRLVDPAWRLQAPGCPGQTDFQSRTQFLTAQSFPSSLKLHGSIWFYLRVDHGD